MFMHALRTELAIGLIGLLFSTGGIVVGSPPLTLLGVVLAALGVGMLLRRAMEPDS